MHLLRGVLWALVGALPGIAAAETVQDFNVPGKGTPCIPIQSNNPPPPELMPDGPIPDGGKFLRLASANPQPGPPNSNTITCRTTDRGRFDLVVADFDFRMSPGVGRADGLGFALLNTKFFGRKRGIVPQGPPFAVEEPNFMGSGSASTSFATELAAPRTVKASRTISATTISGPVSATACRSTSTEASSSNSISVPSST